jgi:hypothetical protein
MIDEMRLQDAVKPAWCGDMVRNGNGVIDDAASGRLHE